MNPSLKNFIPKDGKRNDWYAIESAYPKWVQSMVSTPQDRFHHSEGDVWTHTKMVVDSLIDHPWWHALDEQGQRVTWLTTLLHDCGKPATTVHEESGRISSRGHSQRGAQDARIWLWNDGFPLHEREAVSLITDIHQTPFFTMNKDDYATKMKLWSRTVRLDWLATVAMADALGRRTDPFEMRQKTIEAVELFRLGCEDLFLWGAGCSSGNPYTWQKFMNSPETVAPEYPIVRPNGSDVIMLSGLPGMGKDYWAKKNVPDLPVLSYDDMRLSMNVVHGEKTGEVVHAIWEQAREYLRKKQPFVWNATHISKSMRSKALGLLWNYDANVTLTYLETQSPKTWRNQNNNRPDSVPDKALDQLLFRWEPPSYTEAENVQYWIDGIDQTATVEQMINIGQAPIPTVPSLYDAI